MMVGISSYSPPLLSRVGMTAGAESWTKLTLLMIMLTGGVVIVDVDVDVDVYCIIIYHVKTSINVYIVEVSLISGFVERQMSGLW